MALIILTATVKSNSADHSLFTRGGVQVSTCVFHVILRQVVFLQKEAQRHKAQLG